MWEKHLESSKAVQYEFELEKSDTLPIHSASCHPVHKARELEKQEVNQMLVIYVMERPNWMVHIQYLRT